MNFGGLVLIILVVAMAVVGMYAIAANTSMTAPVDAYGHTTTNADNLTRSNVSATAQVAPTATVFLALIASAFVIFSVIIYFVAARHGRISSRY